MAGDDRPMACKSSPIKVLGETETRAMGAIETVSRRRLRLCHDLRDRSRHPHPKTNPLRGELALPTTEKVNLTPFPPANTHTDTGECTRFNIGRRPSCCSWVRSQVLSSTSNSSAIRQCTMTALPIGVSTVLPGLSRCCATLRRRRVAKPI